MTYMKPLYWLKSFSELSDSNPESPVLIIDESCLNNRCRNFSAPMKIGANSQEPIAGNAASEQEPEFGAPARRFIPTGMES